ncbi:MAG: HXXEE domain-containing protein [Bacillota bacterium]|nr:HXXEE domain-containing protein [Bacillota bacterium]
MDNMKFISIIWLFPLVFMLHDFEEIIFIEWWGNKNKSVLLSRYPRVANIYLKLNTAAIALAVSEEFVILSIITLLSVIFKWYNLWLGVLVGFFIHLIVHLVQWILYKKYIPAIATTIPAMMYSIYAMYFIYSNSNMKAFTVVIWGSLGTIIIFINLLLAHKLARKFNKVITDNTK